MPSLLEKIENSFAEVAPIEKVQSYVKMALSEGVHPVEIMQSMKDGLATAGRKYEQGEFFLSELIMNGIMAQEVSNILKPYLQSSRDESFGKIVIGTVKGDIHDLGKNLVSMMLSSAGFEVVDLGVDVPSEKFADSVERKSPAIVAMSCLLTNAIDEMKITMNRLEEVGVRRRVKVLVGGRPITADFAKEIDADGYAEDAIQAVNVASTIFNKEHHEDKR